jgi:hypothetical protein
LKINLSLLGNLWADPDFFRGVSGQLPSLKDSPDNLHIFFAYFLKILGQEERDPESPESPTGSFHDY